MTLQEAITHAKEKASEQRRRFEDIYGQEEQTEAERKEAIACLDCSNEHVQLVAWLEELQVRREADKWIPVSERLPEEENDYLVCREYRNQVHVTIDHFVSGGFVIFCCDVTHWKPLPKAPESEDN